MPLTPRAHWTGSASIRATTTLHDARPGNKKSGCAKRIFLVHPDDRHRQDDEARASVLTVTLNSITEYSVIEYMQKAFTRQV
ncbi:MAG: hypothetical protein J2P36_38645 [Ktedonobacteraceae bacterium]|nr:hypothetical protein [Ktedonobacteraceae bacterium]